MSHYLMSSPDHFEVVSRLNPWMNPDEPVDRGKAIRQWSALVDVYERLGHVVDVVPAAAGLPDMVFAANAGVSINGRVMTAVMASRERTGEQDHYRKWFDAAGFDQVYTPKHVNEGEGDFLFTGEVLLAGTGFRTDVRAHQDAQAFFDVETVTLQLVDPRWYHLDTALFVLSPDVVVWYPEAFSPASQSELEQRFPDSIRATTTDALAFGLNSTADSNRVVMPASAHELAARLTTEGIEVHTVDLSELLKAGGSVKCCTLDIRLPRVH